MPPNEIHHADLTDEIRDFHPLFEAPHLSDGLILRVLSRKLNITVGEIAKIDPDIAAFEGEIAGVDIAAAFNGTDNGKITPPKLFTHVIDSIRIRVNDTGVEEKVDQVGLATQYPGPYTGTIAFPALAVGPGMFLISPTSERRVSPITVGTSSMVPCATTTCRITVSELTQKRSWLRPACGNL